MSKKLTLVLIHGFPHDGSLWDPQLGALSEVADVLAPDLRGFGSSTLPVTDVLTMEQLAQDLIQLLDERGVQRAVFCGLSMGGYVAMSIIERWPERVQALILCNTRATADTPESRQAREETAINALEKGVVVIARGMVPLLLTESTRRDLPALAQKVETLMARQPATTVAAASRGMAQRPDRMALLAIVAVPTLIITGDADVLMPLPTSEAMHAAIRGSRLMVIPGAGHLSNVEAPAAFNTSILQFISEVVHA